MVFTRSALGGLAALMVLAATPVQAALPVAPSDPARLLDTATFSQAKRVASWIQASGNNDHQRYMIVDKLGARLFLFDQDGTLVATTAVLLGLARGDVSPPGIGDRDLSDIAPAERITPAGRFATSPGKDIDGKDLVWVDYDSAIAIHRASDRKPGMGSKSRVERLSDPATSARRVSLGCINVSTVFYDHYIRSTFGAAQGVVYILPETQPVPVDFAMLPATGQLQEWRLGQ